MGAITTARLHLRRWKAEDADFAFDLYSRLEVQRFIGRRPRLMTDRKEAVDLVERLRKFDHPVEGFWVAARRDTGQPVGTILLKPIPASGTTEFPEPSGDTEIGWHFHPDAWGHGYASEGASAVLGHAFDAGLSKVVAVTHPQNLASQRVCERIGMEYQGVTDRYYNLDCMLFVA